MEFNNLKLSISRKSLVSLSKKQRSKILKEVKKNLRFSYYKKCSIIKKSIINRDIHDIPDIPGPSFSISVDNVNNIDDYGHDDDNLSSSSFLSSSFSSSSSLSNASSCETIYNKPSQIAKC